jgi:hypothetical protein
MPWLGGEWVVSGRTRAAHVAVSSRTQAETQSPPVPLRGGGKSAACTVELCCAVQTDSQRGRLCKVRDGVMDGVTRRTGWQHGRMAAQWLPWPSSVSAASAWLAGGGEWERVRGGGQDVKRLRHDGTQIRSEPTQIPP